MDFDKLLVLLLPFDGDIRAVENGILISTFPWWKIDSSGDAGLERGVGGTECWNSIGFSIVAVSSILDFDFYWLEAKDSSRLPNGAKHIFTEAEKSNVYVRRCFPNHLRERLSCILFDIVRLFRRRNTRVISVLQKL